MFPTCRNLLRAVKIKASRTSAPLYPTLVKAVTATATAALLSACDDRSPQIHLGEAPPVDYPERPDTRPSHYTVGVVVCPERCDIRPAQMPTPIEPDMKSITEQTTAPLDTATSTETNQE